ncbi:MAG: radical SAM family heme chaperone HemW [Oscillospiraceae bacterium]|nr:radical SAM family heme chaperone HemW [Oscillospiraceae bacterium]
MKKNSGNTLGLYIHIPFCKSKCLYCDFYSLPRSEEMMDRYTAALMKHLQELAPHAAANRVDTVYFGGGTPSYLGVKRLKALLWCIRKYYHVEKGAEITLEANPESLGEARIVRALRRAGFNRISLGVQSANNEELYAVGRIHTFEQVERAVAAVRKGRIKNLSLDLIYGLPGQTMESWQKTVETVTALAPEHLSCYGLKIEEGTPLYAMQDGLSLADDDQQADMYLWTAEYLRKKGFEHYEISNFAKDGHVSRHNMKYWMLEEYMGFGPGAHSDVGGVRYSYVRDLASYCTCVESGAGELVDEQERIAPRDRDTEYIMLGLRTAQGIDKTTFENRFRLPFAPIEAVLESFRKSGHAVNENGRWHLTAEGFLISNTIILTALDALGQEKVRREQAAFRKDFRIKAEN